MFFRALSRWLVFADAIMILGALTFIWMPVLLGPQIFPHMKSIEVPPGLVLPSTLIVGVGIVVAVLTIRTYGDPARYRASIKGERLATLNDPAAARLLRADPSGAVAKFAAVVLSAAYAVFLFYGTSFTEDVPPLVLYMQGLAPVAPLIAGRIVARNAVLASFRSAALR
jgi:hypothetical protein